MYVSLDFSTYYQNNLENTTKAEFINGDFNLTTEIEPDYSIIYSSLLLNIITESVMILCFYWAYDYQRSQSSR